MTFRIAFGLVFAASAVFAAAKPVPPRDPVHPFESYGPAMVSTVRDPLTVNWQSAHERKMELLTADETLAKIVESPAAAAKLLARLKPAYATSPEVAIQCAAVTQYVMAPEPPWYLFWRSRAGQRELWVDALLTRAEDPHADAYVRTQCYEQLRWCADGRECVRVRLAARLAAETDRGASDVLKLVIAALDTAGN